MNILFVCKYNRFRSKIAEAYFNYLNGNPSFIVRSAGIFRAAPMNKFVVDYGERLGLNFEVISRGVNMDLIRWQDLVVIVADDVPPSLFKEHTENGKNLVVWKYPNHSIF